MGAWPQYLVLAYLMISLIASVHRGAQRYSLGVNLTGEVVGNGLILGVLWAGGFFAPLGFAP